MMCREMANKNIASLPEMIAVADELGVRSTLCDMSMSLMGIRHEELIDFSSIKTCGVAHFLDLARHRRRHFSSDPDLLPPRRALFR